MENEKEAVTIDKEEYNNLLRDSDLLRCLIACGVDNWSGYEAAIYLLEENE